MGEGTIMSAPEHEAQRWADGTLLSLEAGNAEPTPEQWKALSAAGIEYQNFVRAYGRAIERIDAHHATLKERLGEFTDAAEVERMAARASLAIALALLTAATLDAQNARAERDRAEQGAWSERDDEPDDDDGTSSRRSDG